MRRSAVTFIASCLLLAACGGDDDTAKKESTFKNIEFNAAVEEQVDAGVRYTEMTREAGIDFVHVNGAKGGKFLPETMGAGVAMLDYDSDGDLDLLFAQSRHWEAPEGGQPTMKLYRNDGAWKFTDATNEAGLAIARYGMGLAVADYDADGDPDVYLTCLGPNLLLRNDGGKFVEVKGGPDGGTWKDDEGRTQPSWSSGAAWFDADGDGDLDLLVISYVHWTREIDIHVAYVEDIKAYARPQLYQGDYPRLYLQGDDGSFALAPDAGFTKTAVAGKSLAICLDDFDGDGRTDVFVANDTVQNFLFLNRGNAKFEESAVAAAVAYDDNGKARAAMGVDAVDYRNDGKLSIAIGNFSEEPVSLFTVSRADEDGVLFADDAAKARIGQPTLLPLTFGLVMQDFDLDGWCDLVMANGHIEPSMPKLKPELQYEQAPQFFRNVKGERFADVTLDAGAPFQNRIVGRGLAAGDLDGDGDLDLVFTNNNGKPMVMRADLATKNRSLRLRLRQPGKNRDALGAIVRVKANGMTMRRVVRTGGSYLSQGEFTLTFGLGAAEKAEDVMVRWPDGKEQSFGSKPAGTHLIERK